MDDTLEKLDFNECLNSLGDLDHPFPPRLLRGFSDLSPLQLKKLLPIWVTLPSHRKTSLLEDLEETYEKDTLVNFDELAIAILSDPDPKVRILAIRLLWESEKTRIIPVIIDIMMEDQDEAVRAAAANFLGRFVYLGELESIADTHKISIVRNLLEVLAGEDLPQVKQRALESLGYSSHPKVPSLIKTALESGETLWVSAALCAISHSADDAWQPQVLAHIQASDHEVQFEAVRAAGDLELTASLEALAAILEDEGVDPEIRMAAIWSLSQIGGDFARNTLQGILDSTQDEDEVELVESALENMETGIDTQGYKLMNFDPDSDDEEASLLDEDEDEYEDDEDEDELEDFD
jgi:HEAT repeat protein